VLSGLSHIWRIVATLRTTQIRSRRNPSLPLPTTRLARSHETASIAELIALFLSGSLRRTRLYAFDRAIVRFDWIARRNHGRSRSDRLIGTLLGGRLPHAKTRLTRHTDAASVPPTLKAVALANTPPQASPRHFTSKSKNTQPGVGHAYGPGHPTRVASVSTR